MAGEKSIEGDGEGGVYLNFQQLLLLTRTLLCAKEIAETFYNFFHGRSYCAPTVRADLYSIDVHSFSFEKERTKKANQRLPPLESASVPRYKVG